MKFFNQFLDAQYNAVGWTKSMCVVIISGNLTVFA